MMGNRLQKIQKLFKKTPNALFCLLGAVVFLAVTLNDADIEIYHSLVSKTQFFIT